MKNLVFYPDSVLRKTSEPIKKTSRKIKELAEEMFTVMREANGIGLAAVQVGVLMRLFVLEIPGEEEGDGVDAYAFMNPVIISRKGMCEFEEGCLSFPGIHGNVLRPEEISVRYMNLKGKTNVLHAEGLLARAIQHEMDHLKGILFIDKIVPGDRKKVQKLVKEQVALKNNQTEYLQPALL